MAIFVVRPKTGVASWYWEWRRERSGGKVVIELVVESRPIEVSSSEC